MWSRLEVPESRWELPSGQLTLHNPKLPPFVYNHPEVDRIWDMYVYTEVVRIIGKIIFYLLQDGCMSLL